MRLGGLEQTPQAPNSPAPLPQSTCNSQAGSESPSRDQASAAGGLQQTPQAQNSLLRYHSHTLNSQAGSESPSPDQASEAGEA